MQIEIVSPLKFAAFLAGLVLAAALLVGGVWGLGMHASTPARAQAEVLLPSPTPTPLPTPTPTATATPLPTATAVPDNTMEYREVCRGRREDFPPDYAAARVLASCNHGGENHPQAVVVHATEGNLAGALAHLRDPQSAVSAHYVIDRDGTVYQLVPERVAAYHVACGVEGCVSSCPAFLCGDRHPERRSVGIELVNLGKVPQDWAGAVYEDYSAAFGWRWWEDYPPEQVAALKRLVEDIARRWGFALDAEHVVGHYRVQGKRDPGPALNLFWERNGSPARKAVFP
jgi:N-acetyl-anhydromuramyl-L-alanine amidase AmpD